MEILNKDFKSKFNRKFRYVYLLCVIVFLIYIAYSSRRAEEATLKYKFNGIAQKVEYDKKSTPRVTINGVYYYLGSNSWNFNHLIAKGDSMIKDSNNITIKLIKHETGRVLIFDGTKFYEK